MDYNYPPITLMDKWKFYMKDCPSPLSYIEWGLYSMISAALQRRVYIGDLDEGQAIFTNMFVIFVGGPGIGKGRTLKPVEAMLRHWKRDPKDKDLFFKNDDESKAYKDQDMLIINEVPLLIPVGASASTYQKVVNNLSKSKRSIYRDVNGKKRPYFHSSLTICLEEMSSMFQENRKDLIDFFIVAYDCGTYRYETMSRQLDIVHNCFLNIIAGTTPGFVNDAFSDKLVNEGFASRSIFIVETKSRFLQIRVPKFTDEQKKAKQEILDHLKKVADLFGEIEVSEELWQYIENWWKTEGFPVDRRPNKSPKLEPYYARKNITALKLAVAIHFMDSLSMSLTKEDFDRAVECLAMVESRMHTALSGITKMPDNPTEQFILKLLEKNGKPFTKSEILVETYGNVAGGNSSVEDALMQLVRNNLIRAENGVYKINQQTR
jgi:hypothetical protein